MIIFNNKKSHNFEKYEDFHNGKIHFNSKGNPFFKPDKKTTKEREEKEHDRMEQIIAKQGKIEKAINSLLDFFK